MINPKRCDVWMVDFNPSRGSEQSGVKPALVVSDNNFNDSLAELVIVIPITSKKKNIPLHIELLPPEGGLSVVSYIKCEDIKSISKERLIECRGFINHKTMNSVEEIVKMLLNLK